MESALSPSISPHTVTTPTRPAAAAKNRSLSDPPSAQQAAAIASPAGALQPSPTFRERVQGPGSKDDHDAAAIAQTPRNIGLGGLRRPEFGTRGLSLQMPAAPPAPSSPSVTSGNTSASGWSRGLGGPLSPKVEDKEIYMSQQAAAASDLSASPATSLPRHSRGLDFSRACTNLHHSTLAERQPGDGGGGGGEMHMGSSPVMTTKGMMIPGAGGRKGSVGSMILDSPAMGNGAWLQPERSGVSSSVGSVNMMGSDDESSSSDGDASMGGDDQDDAIFTTPQVHKLQNPSAHTPFHGSQTPNWASGPAHFSPAQASLMKTIRRNKLHKGGRRTRKSSSSASGSGYSSMASPRTTSPPPLRSIESATNGGPNHHTSGGYFQWAAANNAAARSRRESLALGTEPGGQPLHLSSGNDSGDEASSAHTAPSTPGVVRRPVVRRGNLLPKTKGFARIRAALLEEAAPVDTDMRRESETIRQVRERDGSVSELDLTQHDSGRPGTATAASSPNLLPAVPEAAQEDFGRDEAALDSSETDGGTRPKGPGMTTNFALHASRNSGGMEYWNRFDPALRTPPPPPSFPRQGSSAMSDINMGHSPSLPPSQQMGGGGGGSTADVFWRRPRARSSASDASDAFMAASGFGDEVALKKFKEGKKRRREEDWDIATIKRRAVSPGMGSSGAGNSPVLTQSPGQRDGGGGGGGGWGMPPEKKGGAGGGGGEQQQQQGGSQNGRSNSGGSVAGGAGGFAGLASQGKKLGLQGMVDTNDGLMKMSIE